MPWVPTAFGTGIAFYFAADREPMLGFTLATAMMLVVGAFLLRRQAVVHPSFQMSFAATLGLVALVQIGMPRLFATQENSAASWSP